MIYARQPTPEELQELQRMRRQAVGRVSQRAHMVLLSLERHSVSEIAQLFGTCRPTLRFWIKRYNQAGPPGLYDEPRSRRPAKAGEAVKSTLQELLQNDPQGEGYLATFWTVAMLLAVLAKQLQVALSASTLRTVLHRQGCAGDGPAWPPCS